MAKLLFDSLRGVKLQKNFGQKFFVQKVLQDAEKLASKDVRCPQNRPFKKFRSQIAAVKLVGVT
jgi:hypothetical protein